MHEPEILKDQEAQEILQLTAAKNSSAVMSHMASGKWHTTEVAISGITDSTLHISLEHPAKPRPISIQINQPLGVSFQQEFNKYIFETVVLGIESSVQQTGAGRIVLERPGRIERLQRRAYVRVPVPTNLKIKVLFWHRGYTDDSMEVPLENYWQGKLVDLSAGGAQVAIGTEHGPNFRVGQLVGLQFTPMSHKKPFLLEAYIRHLAENTHHEMLYVGLEFLGLEASDHGRDILRKIVDVIEEYQKLNAENNNNITTPSN